MLLLLPLPRNLSYIHGVELLRDQLIYFDEHVPGQLAFVQFERVWVLLFLLSALALRDVPVCF